LAPRTIRPVLVVAAGALALGLFAVPAHASIISPRAAHSPNADDIRTAYWVMLGVAVLLGLAIHVALFAAIGRYRARRGTRPAQYTAGHGVFRRAALPLVALAVAIFVFGVVMTTDVRSVPSGTAAPAQASGVLTAQVGVTGLPEQPAAKAAETASSGPTTTSGSGGSSGETANALPANGGPLEIRAVGQQWLWRFDYPNSGAPGPPFNTFSYNQLVVPVNTVVILDLESTDVIHRWFVPALGGQADAVPGETNQTWFRADREGIYPGQSTSYSGTGYSAMRIWVKVVSPEAYQTWIQKKTQAIQTAQNYVQKRVSDQSVVGGVTLP
jgi:cytochrome c oxidase subunit 2